MLFPSPSDLITLSTEDAVQRVLVALAGYRWPLRDEVALHEAMSAKLSEAGLVHEREYPLSRTSRIDFFLPSSGVGIEVKVHGSPTDVLRQLQRYAGFPEVKSLILVTGRAALAPYIPRTLCGTPLYVFTCWEWQI